MHYTLRFMQSMLHAAWSLWFESFFCLHSYAKTNIGCTLYEVPNRHSMYKEKSTYDSAFLRSKIWCPRQLQKTFFAPFSFNGGRSCHTDLLQLDTAVLWVKKPCNNGLVQLYSPYDTGRIRYPAKVVVSGHEIVCKSHDDLRSESKAAPYKHCVNSCNSTR